MIVGLVLIGVSAALAGYSMFRHESVVQMVADTFTQRPDQVFGKPNVLVLVEGLDYDYTDADQEFSTNSRSDVIWAVNLDFGSKSIYKLSIPRDMVATLPNGKQAKINQAQSDGGVKEAKQVISGWLGVPGFDRYILLRINATKDLINAIGGVDVFVKTSECLQSNTSCSGGRVDYDDNWGHLHVHLKEGLQHLDGDQAVGYMRFRHDYCSDPCRIMRQEQVLQATVDKAKGDRMNTLMHAGNLLSVFRKDVVTDFSDNEMFSLASYFSDMPKDHLHVAQVPIAGDVSLPDYGDSTLPDKEARAQLVQSMLIAPPVPIPSPDAMALAGVAPSSVRVDVRNGSGVPGAARHVADLLRKQGFAIGSVGDADKDTYAASEIHQHSNIAFAGAKVRAALPNVAASANVVQDGASLETPDPTASATAAPSDVTLIVGKDLVNPPAAAAKPSP